MSLMSKLLGRNTRFTSKKTILDQMWEPRPLPLGMKEFDEWSSRILSGAMIPSTDQDSLKATLAVMLQSLGPQESHKPDAYFIHSLRKAATNEVARHIFTEIKKKKEAEHVEATKVVTEHQNAHGEALG